MKDYRRLLSIFVSAVLAGFCITFGATAYLLLIPTAKYLGMFLFCTGLFTIIHFNLYLYTGKIGYVVNNKPIFILDCFITLVGNFVGVLILSLIFKATRLSPALVEAATAIVNVKQADSYISIFIQAIMCGVMIYLAVEGHKKCPYNLGKVIFAFLPIVMFIVCGFEHCVANVAYYTYAGVFSWDVVVRFLFMILGDAVGSIAFASMIILINKLKEPKIIDGSNVN